MLIIKNGKVIDPEGGGIEERDIGIHEGVVCEAEERVADRIIEAGGMYVAPGLVDIHVHLREPGYEYKEDIWSGSMAAKAGGYTSIACMANTKPVTDKAEAVGYILERGRETGIRVVPIGAVTYGLRGEVLTDFAALKAAGVCALSDDGNPIMNAQLMQEALREAKRVGLKVISHSEDAVMTDRGAVNEGSVSADLGIAGRPSSAEEYMIARDAVLARYTDSSVHIAHVSTAGSVGILRWAKSEGIRISAETCPQYFYLTEERVRTMGALAKMYPPLRTETDRRGIIEGLRDGTIDIIATDHAPHSDSEKGQGIEAAPGGMIGLETALSAALTVLYHGGVLDLCTLIQKMTVNPARLLGLPLGSVRIGGRGDLVIFDADESWTVERELLHSKSRNTPFLGEIMKGRVKYTICDGKIQYEQKERRE